MDDNGNASGSFTVSIDLGDEQGTLERLLERGTPTGQLRLACWSQDRTLASPLVLSEDELVQLISKGLRVGILSPDFLKHIQSEFEI